ncbi:ABC transporter ATP-binding protein [Candidatus Saccharibacteria bacterium]|nr:ABC transporter ATP-binding protein [Candidatus Saccharibacteria bacterium]
MSIVSVKNISKIFGSGHTAVKAVQNVSLQIKPGDIVLIMGPSGSGKTTLISMVGALMSPTDGDVRVEGQGLGSLKPGQLADLRLKEFGFIFQSFNLLSALSAEKNVMLPLLVAGLSQKQARCKARASLEKLGLGSQLRNLPKDLSGGEKQRVAVARALANDPKVILADEPTANLDKKTGVNVMVMLCEIACRENRAVIIVSHDERLKAVAKRVITIEDGKLVREEAGQHNRHCRMHTAAGLRGAQKGES